MDGRYSLNGGTRSEKEFYDTYFKPYFESKGAEVRQNDPNRYQGIQPDFTVVFGDIETNIELKTCNYIKADTDYEQQEYWIEYQQVSDESYKLLKKHYNEGWRYYCDADEIWFWLPKVYKVICVDWKKLKRDLDSDDMKRKIVKPEYTVARPFGEGRERLNAASLFAKNDDSYEEHCILPYIEAWGKDEMGIKHLVGRKIPYRNLFNYVIDELDIYEDGTMGSANYEI